MKRSLTILLSLVLILQSVSTGILWVSAEDVTDVAQMPEIVEELAEDIQEGNIPQSIKILAIGNSYSEDATAWLYNILSDLGVNEIVIGNLYIGSCTLQKHSDNAATGKEAYTYYRGDASTNGKMTAVEGKKSLLYGLQDEAWDYISFQEASRTSGIRTAYEPYLTQLIEFVNKNKTNPNAKLMWHMTWTYKKNSTHSAFPQYGINQQVMYKSIVQAAKDMVLPHKEISIVIPSGTVIQNMRTSIVGNTLTRDGYHMSKSLGRYALGVMWAKSILQDQFTDYSLLKTLPDIEPAITPEQLMVLTEGVENAYNNPFEVTLSKIVTPEILKEREKEKSYTIVEATHLGKYDEQTDTFYFNDGSLVHNNENIVYLPDAAIRMEGTVCCYVDNTFYAPQYIIDCMSGLRKYEKFSGEIAKCHFDTKTENNKMTGTFVIKNYLKDTPIEGIARFKDEALNSAVGDVEISSIKGRETGYTKIELPLEIDGAYAKDLSYDFITKHGTYSYSDLRHFIFVDKVDNVTVDGKISAGEWDKATKLVLDEKSVADIKEWSGEEDLSAVAYVSYGDDELYIAAEVTDDVFAPVKHNVWLDGDSIQVDFYVDENGHFDPDEYESNYTEAGFGYYDNTAGVHRYKSQTGKLARGMVENAKSAVTQEGNKTTYEMAVKWADLFGEEFTPKADNAIGFAFIVNEKDGEKPDGWLKFASGAGGNAKRNPNKFAQMYFVGKEQIDDGSFVEDGIKYIPFRKAFEKSSAEISWDDTTKTAYAVKDGKTVRAAIGALDITINGQTVKTGGVVKLIEGRTYIPEINIADLFKD